MNSHFRAATKTTIVSVCLTASGLLAHGAVPDDKPAEAKVEPQKIAYAHITIKGSYTEGPQAPDLFGSMSETLSAALARLDKAAGDDKITGVILRIDDPSIGWGKLNELRQAIAGVRKSGKKVYALVDSPGTKDYLVASACDEIVMPESGTLMMLGLRAEVSFYKNLLDMLDVKGEMLRVGEYKSAAEPFNRTEMSEPFRREMEAVLDDYYDQIKQMVGDGRGLKPDAVEAAIDAGPHTAKTAKARGLIDRVAYADEVRASLEKQHEGAEFSIVKDYGKKKLDTDFSGFSGLMKMMNLLMGVEPKRRKDDKPKLAVIYATGAIMTGKSQSSPFIGNLLGSDTLVKTIDDVAKDETVKAIVLRVDSPGGSALASDLIWRSLENAQAAGKPVVVSMGDVAASGGYYISMGADKIYAEPGTLTGSIGVVGGKLAFDGLFRKVGVTTSVISRGKNSGLLSTLHGFSESEKKAMQKLLDDVYEQFTKKAAEGRGMEYADLEKKARGRVYTGATAKKIGLVDELGTLEDAIAAAKKLAKIDPETELERQNLPKPTSPFEALFGPLEVSVNNQAAGARHAGALIGAVEQVSLQAAEHLRNVGLISLFAKEPRLTLMPFRITIE